MSGAVWIVAAVALAAALALVTALVLKRRRGDAPLGPATAAEAAEAGVPGFAAREALIGDDRRTALVVGGDRRVALVTARGQRALAREIRWSDIRAAEGGLHVARERGGGTVFVGGIDVLDVRRAGEDDWRRR